MDMVLVRVIHHIGSITFYSFSLFFSCSLLLCFSPSQKHRVFSSFPPLANNDLLNNISPSIFFFLFRRGFLCSPSLFVQSLLCPSLLGQFLTYLFSLLIVSFVFDDVPLSSSRSHVVTHNTQLSQCHPTHHYIFFTTISITF